MKLPLFLATTGQVFVALRLLQEREREQALLGGWLPEDLFESHPAHTRTHTHARAHANG